MKVRFIQSGGFAGLRRAAALDSDALPPQQKRDIETLVERAGFFELPDKIEAPTPGADRFQYRLTVESGGRQHTVQVGDGAVPPRLEPLLEKLRAAAQPEPAVPASAPPKQRR